MSGVSPYDEMYDGDGRLRPAYAHVGASVASMAAGDLEARAAALMSTFTDRGVTFNVDGGVDERPFPLDMVPRILPAGEWSLLEAGVRQRVRTLEAFLDDVYGAGQCFDDGVLPRRVVTSSPHFHRAAHGVVPANGVRIHVSGIDLVRDDAGEFRILEDNVRVPSGVSYVIEN
ncbi:MAG: circularly permuted type 2 ATP-grasp protein, partial [Frankiaceae bacterium]|nr:circularly permuted type 2 ATP-grasp protein [Frankiaceae bacterium]